MPPRKKREEAAPTTLADAVRDLRSDAWREMLAGATLSELDALLDGVTWAQPKSYEPGALVPTPAWTVKGRGRVRLLARLLELAARAPDACARAVALRDATKSVTVCGEPGGPLDLAPYASLRALEWLRVVDAGSLLNADAVAFVPRIELRAIAEVDVTPLARVETLHVGGWDAVRSRVRGLASSHARELRVTTAVLDDVDFGAAREVHLMPTDDCESLGPLRGGGTSLCVYNSHGLRALSLGAWPSLEQLRISGCRALERLDGADACATLRSVTLDTSSMRALPPLPATLEALFVWGDAMDLSGLARLTSLRRLEVVTIATDLSVVASLSKLEALSVGPRVELDAVLAVLPALGSLRELSLRNRSLERVPELGELAPTIEVLSLVGCGGFLEHDTLARMPALRTLYLARSTLARHRRQIEPRLKERGVTLDFDREH